MPYLWGSADPENGGLDCSGAIYYIYKSAGKPIPRTTSRKLYFLFDSKPVNWNKAKKGYLIWWTFSNERPYGHVGMVDSNNTAWQASSSKGITNIKLRKNGYWDKIFEECKKGY